jgi:periplasmic divalent cation tolerance protein
MERRPVAVKGKARLSRKQVMLLVTAATRDEAENLGEALLGRGLAQRGSVIPGIHSFWMEDQKLERSHEAMLLVTTSSDKAREAVAYVRQNHSFEEPQIVILPMADEYPA